MNKLLAPLLFALTCGGVALAEPPQPSDDAAAIKAIQQLELDMGDAMIRTDLDKLGEMYADDFMSVEKSGRVFRKKDIMRDFESFHDKLLSFDQGPIAVQVFGNFAVASGGVWEKRLHSGKDVSGKFLWTDLLEKHDGKWQVYRSIGARLE